MSAASSQHLSWQSAFGGISALALNTMFQEAGSFGNLPELARYVLRSSPIFCVADILLIVGLFLALLPGHGFLTALRIVALLRYPAGCRTPPKATVGNQVKSLFLFIAMLSQLVKLLTCKGIPWTQASAIMYMVLYLLEGLLRHIAVAILDNTASELRSQSTIRINHCGQFALSVIALLQYAFWIVASFQAYPPAMNHACLSIDTLAITAISVNCLKYQALMLGVLPVNLAPLLALFVIARRRFTDIHTQEYSKAVFEMAALLVISLAGVALGFVLGPESAKKPGFNVAQLRMPVIDAEPSTRLIGALHFRLRRGRHVQASLRRELTINPRDLLVRFRDGRFIAAGALTARLRMMDGT
ncbi:uncharacterized protein LTR77_006902 [Saxophila tyrrhenica]|uniref:Uncharacterized protein n=1 Tax=Saxophila tyrrhenica TaxID=1690608 RepID=A0AAV9P6M9_9PEZI|nr:hypothetical protein LTR77_006902 [Saxophila tyrrhenica]